MRLRLRGLSAKFAVILSGELEKLLGRRVDPTVAYQYPTITALAQALLAQRQEAPKVERREATSSHDIAIVGSAGRFPGAKNNDEFWQMLIDGRSAEAADTLKCMMVKVDDPREVDEDGQPVGPQLVGVLIPGDRELDEKRLEASLEPATFELASDEDFAKNDFLVKGYVGPRALAANGVRVLADPRVVDGTAWITGADEANRHVVDLVVGRDFHPAGTIEAAEVREGDEAPGGHGTLTLARGIEMGHIFQLGRKYAEALDLKVLDVHGKQVVVTMGSYGIGITRAVAAIAERYHDDKGLAWPRAVAPADVHVVVATKGEDGLAAAETLAAGLEAEGLTVLVDDRPKVSPGVKFKDAELIGVPTTVVIGRGLADGELELKDRATGEARPVPVDGAVAAVLAEVRDGR